MTSVPGRGQLPSRVPPRVALTCGVAGSGKTTLALRLEREGYVRLSFDDRAWEAGHRDHPVAPSVAAGLHEELRARLVVLVEAGHDVVVDSSFWSRAARQSYRDLLAPLGIAPVVHHLATPRDVVLARLAARRGTGGHDIVVPTDLAVAYLDGFEVPTTDEGPLVVHRGAIGKRRSTAQETTEQRGRGLAAQFDAATALSEDDPDADLWDHTVGDGV